MTIKIEDKCFCFTGTLADLKRSAAAREVRSRNGFTQNSVNEKLDYLVVGSIPNKAWKYGKYGSKIKKAIDIAKSSKKPKIIPENQFMEALLHNPVVTSGDVDEKILLLTIRFQADEENIELLDEVEALLARIHDEENCLVKVYSFYIQSYNELFEENELKEVDNEQLIVECKFIKYYEIDENVQPFIEMIEREFEKIDNLDPSSKYTERLEGSATYYRLIKELPKDLRIKKTATN